LIYQFERDQTYGHFGSLVLSLTILSTMVLVMWKEHNLQIYAKVRSFLEFGLIM